ncbi:MAG: penicillin-binding protein activator, partial [Gammaproteobacteria bacterium]
GGEVVEMQTYDATRNDFSRPIKMLLDIDASEQRRRRIAALVGTDVQYTTRRRQDIDFIFVAAFPRQARAIRPQLKFFYAGDVPVYTTSHAFTGNLNPERDRDMDGMMFGDMPWVLAQSTSHRGLYTQLEGQISAAGNSLQRLYALGIDAYNIIGALNTLKAYPYERFDGETGSLSLDARQRVRRQLTWVRFRSGQPVPTESALQ